MAHKKQKRKTFKFSFITHPITVGLILEKTFHDEDLTCAGILHDVVEDTPKELEFDFSFIKREFGERVADLVYFVTEKDKSEPWEIRKQRALDEVSNMTQDALQLKTADLISNVSDIVKGLEVEGIAIERNFKRPLTLYLKRYQNLVKAIGDRIENKVLLDELVPFVTKLSAFLSK